MIGVFDSGIGGLTILDALRKKLPDTGFLYFGDHQNAPYGTKAPEQIHEMTRDAVRYCFDQGCELVILACNTASAVALHDLQTDWLPEIDPSGEKRVLGVFVPMIEAMTKRDWGDNAPPTHTGLKDVLLFATPATVASGAFARELKFRARDVVVEGVPCAGLVESIEMGDHAGMQRLVDGFVAEGLERIPNPQTAALACTHYPIAYGEFRKALPLETVIFSQPEIVAQSLFDYLARHTRFQNQTGDVIYKTSGDATRVSKEASRFIGHDVQFEAV